MSRRTLFAVALFLATLLSPAGVRAFGVHDVIKLHQQQVSDSLIVRWPVYRPYVGLHYRYPFRRW